MFVSVKHEKKLEWAKEKENKSTGNGMDNMMLTQKTKRLSMTPKIIIDMIKF